MTTDTLEQVAQEADERAVRQAARRQELEDRFRQIAEGKPWYEGTGNDDQVFPHQWVAACFGAVAGRWFCGDRPGLGKTRTGIGWLDLVGSRKVVIIAEANVASQFAGEIMELAPHRTVFNLAGLSKKTRHEQLVRASRMEDAILVINYEMFRRDQDSLVKVLAWQADTVIVDEAHNIKTVKTGAFKMVQRLLFTDNTCEECGGLITGLSKPCKRCNHTQHQAGLTLKEKRELTHSQWLATKSVKKTLLLTGTPLLNTPLDLYPLLHLTRPTVFPTVDDFKKRFLKPSFAEGTRKMVFKRNGLDDLQPFIKDFFLARDLEDVGEREVVDGMNGVRLPNGQFLPDQHERIVRVEVDPERYPLQLRTIKQISEQARLVLSTGESATLMHMIQIISRKRQANVWPGGIEIRDTDSGEIIMRVGDEVQESAKMDECLEQLLAYHGKGHRQVVFSQFRTALAEFETRVRAAGLRVARFDGSTKKTLREEIKSNFYRAKGEKPKWDVVLVHYRTGGAGVNLTAATVTHILDEEWNAGKRDQGYGRTHRIGQTESTEVLVYRIPNSIDTFMANLIRMKEKLAKELKSRMMSNEEMIFKVGDAIKKGEIL